MERQSRSDGSSKREFRRGMTLRMDSKNFRFILRTPMFVGDRQRPGMAGHSPWENAMGLGNNGPAAKIGSAGGLCRLASSRLPTAWGEFTIAVTYSFPSISRVAAHDSFITALACSGVLSTRTQ